MTEQDLRKELFLPTEQYRSAVGKFINVVNEKTGVDANERQVVVRQFTVPQILKGDQQPAMNPIEEVIDSLVNAGLRTALGKLPFDLDFAFDRKSLKVDISTGIKEDERAVEIRLHDRGLYTVKYTIAARPEPNRAVVKAHIIRDAFGTAISEKEELGIEQRPIWYQELQAVTSILQNPGLQSVQ